MQARHRLVAGLLVSGAVLVGVVATREPPASPEPAAVQTSPPAGTPIVPLGVSDLTAVFAAGSPAGLLGRPMGDRAPGDDPGPPLADRPGEGTRGLGCRSLRAEQPGAPVAGWQVDGRVASVVLVRRDEAGEVLPLSAWLPPESSALLDGLARDPRASTRVHRVARRDLRLPVEVVSLPVAAGTLVLSDLGRPGGHRWAELRDPAAAGCRLDPALARVVGDGSGPVADAGGWGPVRVGTPLEQLVAEGVVPLPPAGPEVAGSGCTSVEVPDGAVAGLRSLLVQAGVVRAVGLGSGSVVDGDAPPLAVGAPATRVRGSFPDRVGPAELQAMRDNSGVVVPLDGAAWVVVSVARPSAVLADLDVPVTGPEPLVASLLVGLPCGSP